MSASITSDQEVALVGVAEAGARKAIRILKGEGVLTVEAAQRAFERGDEIQAVIFDKMRELIQDQYADQEVPSNYGYLSGYARPKGITKQVEDLLQRFPSLNPESALRYNHDVYPKLELPDWVEGPFAIPQPERVAPIYGEAVKMTLTLLNEARNGKFYNYLGDNLGEAYLRQHERTVRMIQTLVEQQGNPDILIVPAQFGIRHRGRSVLRAREKFQAREFGLGAFGIGIMILTHPERLQHYDDLWIDCAGDEYAPDADGAFSNAPCFDFDDGRLGFFANWVDDPDERCGSASAFAPQ